MTGDIDNTIKPILDSLSGVIYFDDRQVERLMVQKFEPDRPATFERPTPSLLRCAASSGQRTYIRVDDDRSWELRDASR
jgi:crossover junction endodeoxyribonuclease RusA